MSASYATAVTEALAEIPATASKVGSFVGRDGSRAVVIVNTSTVTVPFVGMTLPPPGHPVQLELSNGSLVCTGSARPLPGIGKITATGSPRAEVTAWGATYLLPYRSGYTPALGDNVEVSWSIDGGVIQGKVTALSTTPAPVQPPPEPPQTYHPQPFTALDSGSYRGGWWTNDVYASDNNAGAWFYGNKIRDTIPDAARILTASIYLSPRSVSGDPPLLRLHTHAGRPGGGVNFVNSSVGLDRRDGWVPIPLWTIDYLKANEGGLGFDHGGYTIFRGKGSDDLSGALDISWEA